MTLLHLRYKLHPDVHPYFLSIVHNNTLMKHVCSQHGKNKYDVHSSVECYISEHGVARDVALAKISSMIEDAWKTTNQARFDPPELLPAIQRVANVTISIPFMYDDQKDAFTFNSSLEGTIKDLFVNHIPFTSGNQPIGPGP